MLFAQFTRLGQQAIRRMQEILPEFVFNILGGIDAIGVYTGLLQPIPVAMLERLTHPRIASVQVRQRCQLIVKFLPRYGRIADRRRPVINIGFGLSWI